MAITHSNQIRDYVLYFYSIGTTSIWLRINYISSNKHVPLNIPFQYTVLQFPVGHYKRIVVNLRFFLANTEFAPYLRLTNDVTIYFQRLIS